MKSKNLSENILRSVKSKGFKYIDLPSVIEADHIVQRSGENFRKFIFSFIDQNGSELCLRPDLTIASCLRYLENNLKGKEKIFYSGQAYRKSQNKKDSIIRNQIGFEILGSKDEKNDDKEIIATSLKSLQNLKYSSGTLTIGNVEIFKLLISKLEIPARWKLRLLRHFWRDEYFNDLLKRLETNADIDPTVVEVDKKKYLDLLKQDSKTMIAGRSIGEILKRFDTKIKDPRTASKGKKVSKIIRSFFMDLLNKKELIAKTGLGNIKGNFYFGNGKPGIHPSFDLHSHGYNVIQKQIYGTNYWTVDEQQYEIHKQEIIL
mgnify:CR=1 FL=1